MKKSEIYRKAQYAVVDNFPMKAEEKMEILRLLIKEEDLALFCEKEKGNAE